MPVSVCELYGDASMDVARDVAQVSVLLNLPKNLTNNTQICTASVCCEYVSMKIRL